MKLRKLRSGWRRRFRRHRLLQIALLVGFWLAGEQVVRSTGLPLPGSLAGMFIVLLLLASKQLSVRTLRRGAQWFIGEMLLFFVPAVLALLDHPELLGWAGLKILIVIGAGTVIVMAVTAGAIDLCFRAGLGGKGNVDLVE